MLRISEQGEMAKTPRRIISGKVYELCFRARKGLPLPPTLTINAIIAGVMARVQRDYKVTICHYLWMSNHAHFILVVKDANQSMKFYMELQKKLTEAIKKLLSINRLNLWEGTPMVALVPDVDTVMERISYLYANPAAADLESSIDKFCGMSSWDAFAKSGNTVDSKNTKTVPWIRNRDMETLPHPALSRHQDKFYSEKFKTNAKKQHVLTVEPNAWMSCFGIKKSEEIQKINKTIRGQILLREHSYEEKRKEKGKSVLGSRRLVAEPILKEHVPKKKNKKIFLICHDKDLRISLIAEFQEFHSRRRERYEEWKLGDFSSNWPPGCYRPPMPPLANEVQFYN